MTAAGLFAIFAIGSVALLSLINIVVWSFAHLEKWEQ